MSTSASYPFCIATIVTDKAIKAMLEVSGMGSYRDSHPWLVARDLFANAQSNNQIIPILFAVTGEVERPHFSHWSTITNIDVVELHRGQWDSRCEFDSLQPFNPIFEDIDSVFVKASAEQMLRERLENIRVVRHALDEHHIHPYAICETPVFIDEVLAKST